MPCPAQLGSQAWNAELQTYHLGNASRPPGAAAATCPSVGVLVLVVVRSCAATNTRPTFVDIIKIAVAVVADQVLRFAPRAQCK